MTESTLARNAQETRYFVSLHRKTAHGVPKRIRQMPTKFRFRKRLRSFPQKQSRQTNLDQGLYGLAHFAPSLTGLLGCRRGEDFPATLRPIA